MNTQNQFLSFEDLNSQSQALYVKDEAGKYKLAPTKEILLAARVQVNRVLNRGKTLNEPYKVKAFLNAKLSGFEHEVFACLFLDNQLRLIEYQEMFHGTVNSAIAYPREIVKAALRLNAVGVFISHNHPSGATKPSHADIEITNRIKTALDVMGITLLDHILVAGARSISFSEEGYL